MEHNHTSKVWFNFKKVMLTIVDDSATFKARYKGYNDFYVLGGILLLFDIPTLMEVSKRPKFKLANVAAKQ